MLSIISQFLIFFEFLFAIVGTSALYKKQPGSPGFPPHRKNSFYTATAHFLILPISCIKLGMIISIKTLSLIQRKRPFPVQMYRKRPEIKGFHGSIGSSGRAVKAFFLYTVVIVETACKVTPPPICRKRNN